MGNQPYPMSIKKPATKSIFSSVTIIGLMISVLSRFFDLGVNADEASNLWSSILEVWPIIIGIGTDFWAKYTRYNKEDFNKSIFVSKTFWITIASLVASMLGIAQEEANNYVHQIEEVIPKITMIVGGLLAIIGSIRAKKQIK